MFKVISHIDDREWDRYVGQFDDAVMWKLEYYRFYLNEGAPQAAIYEDDGQFVFYPYLKKTIEGDWLPDTLRDRYYDISTAYGFGGPLVKCSPDREERLIAEFRAAFDRYCRASNIVTEFARFHPLRPCAGKLAGHMDVEKRKLNVYIDIKPEWREEDFLKSYLKSSRKKVRKAERLGVTATVDETGEKLEQFLQVYNHTMNRRKAADYYYFSPSFFQHIVSRFRGNFVFFHAWYEGRIISSELAFYDDKYLYAFLGGTLFDYYHVSSENFLKHFAVMWAHGKGIEKYVLGGGYQENDGIFIYKKSFAPNNLADFCIGKKTHNQAVYDELYEIRSRQGCLADPDYYPAYRGRWESSEPAATLTGR